MTPPFEGPWIGEKRCFSESHLSTLRKKYGNLNHLHRALFVGEYLSQLREAGLDPLFRGGSALMYLLPDLRRLSEDLDLSLDDMHALLPALEGVRKRFPSFTYAPDVRQKGVHYKLDLPAPARGYIILDAIEGNPGYATRKIALKCSLYESDTHVRVPTLNAVMGDKLTTLGRRIGLEFGRRPPIEHAKQLYDLSRLVLRLDDLNEALEAFRKTVAFQCRYRGVRCTDEQALDDFAEVMRLFMLTPPNAPVRAPIGREIAELRIGLQALENLLERKTRFSTGNARIAAARMLYFSGILRRALGGETVTVKKLRADFAELEAAIHDKDIVARAGKIVREKEPLIWSKELQNDETEALLFVAAYHGSGVLLER